MTVRHDKRSIMAVHVCADEAEADLVMSLLRGHGIDCFANTANAIIPVAAGPMSEVAIYVDENNAEKATDILNQGEK